MTDQLPPRSTGALDRELFEPRSTPDTTDQPSREFHGQTWQRGGSDPTTPPIELDPDRLGAMLPRSRWS